MNSFIASIALTAFLLATRVSAQETATKGAVVLSRVSPVAVLIWDASIALNELTADHVSESKKMRTLESDAAKILCDRAAGLTADTIEVRVIYAKTNLGAQYGDATLDAKEKLVVLRAQKKDALACPNAWARALASGARPKYLRVEVTGKLPPP